MKTLISILFLILFNGTWAFAETNWNPDCGQTLSRNHYITANIRRMDWVGQYKSYWDIVLYQRYEENTRFSFEIQSWELTQTGDLNYKILWQGKTYDLKLKDNKGVGKGLEAFYAKLPSIPVFGWGPLEGASMQCLAYIPQ